MSGYQLDGRKLVAHADEAVTVRLIFQRYLDLGSLNALMVDLRDRGIRSKMRTYADGRTYGNQPLRPGPLSHLLRNPIYIGMVRHKGDWFEGEHEGIVDRASWDAVQARLDDQRTNHHAHWDAQHPSLLSGMLVDGEKRPMRPSHSTRGSRRYRYYETRPTDDGAPLTDGWRVPAGDIEEIVCSHLASWLRDPARLLATPEIETGQSAIVAAAAGLASILTAAPIAERRTLMLALGTMVSLQVDQIEVELERSRLRERLGRPAGESADKRTITIAVPAKLVRRGHELRLSFSPTDRGAPNRIDNTLVELLGRAQRAYDELIAKGSSYDRIRRAHLTRLARLTCLAPDIVTSILDGRQPAALSARGMLRATHLPTAWAEQRELFGYR